jgi:MFS family permease
MLVAGGMLALLAAPETYALALFVLLFGSGAGLLTTLRAAVVVRIAPNHVAQQLGAYNFLTSMARALAPVLSNWLYFAVGYEPALITFSAMAMVAAVLVWRATSCSCAQVPSTCSVLTDQGPSTGSSRNHPPTPRTPINSAFRRATS